MKAVRLLQILIVLAAGAYLVLLHDMNDVNVVMPFLFSLPPAVLLVAAILLGWLLGWVPGAFRAMRQRRELRQLRRRVADLERQREGLVLGDPETPIIPDRRPAEPGEQERYDGHENL